MLKEVLSEEMISIGAELTAALDRTGWPVVASLWLYDSEINQWRLVVASPTVDETGPLAAYGVVDSALDALHRTLPLSGLSVVSPKHPIIRALLSSGYAYPDVRGRRVSHTMVEREFVDDAYLYKVTRIAPVA